MIEAKQKKLKKIKKRLISFFKSPKEVISFFLPILITILLLIPVPYYVKLGGGVIKLSDKVEIDKKGKDGYFGALYVREKKGNVMTYLLTYIIPSFDKEKIENVTINEENSSNYNYHQKLY